MKKSEKRSKKDDEPVEKQEQDNEKKKQSNKKRSNNSKIKKNENESVNEEIDANKRKNDDTKIKVEKNNKNKEEQTETEKEEKTLEVEEKEIGEIGKIIKEERRKKLPDDERTKIIKQSIYNGLIAITISLYFLFLGLGFKNIEKGIFITDLKVFSVSILIIAIFLFEKSYKMENKKIALYGIEVLSIAICTIALLYVCIISQNIFLLITICMAVVSIVYYIIKILLNYILTKRKYNIENNELNVISKEEVE